MGDSGTLLMCSFKYGDVVWCVKELHSRSVERHRRPRNAEVAAGSVPARSLDLHFPGTLQRRQNVGQGKLFFYRRQHLCKYVKAPIATGMLKPCLQCKSN